MWKTLHVEALKKAYRHPNRYSNKRAACQASAHASGVSGGSARSGGIPRFDVPAQAALRRDVLDVAQGKPHLAGRNAGAEGLVRGASPDPCQD